MRSTIYPTLEEALYLHEKLLEVFGGLPGVRDKGLLESALARPRSGYYNSLSEQAAALLHSLVHNHAFIDGNKRVAFSLTAVFLLVNGFHLKVTADVGEEFLIETVIKSRCELSTITEWIERHIASK